MNDEARLAAWHRNVYESYDEPEPCDGCEERDAEIERLTGAVEELTIDNQGLAEALRAAHEDTVGLRAEVEKLQGLIDSYADSHRQSLMLEPPETAVRRWMRHTVNISRLLAAATKEADRV